MLFKKIFFVKTWANEKKQSQLKSKLIVWSVDFVFFVRDERNCGQRNCNIITGRYMKMLSVNLQQSNDLGSDELVTPNSGMGFPLKL